jgi:hypothetical protein
VTQYHRSAVKLSNVHYIDLLLVAVTKVPGRVENVKKSRFHVRTRSPFIFHRSHSPSSLTAGTLQTLGALLLVASTALIDYP